MFYEIFIGDENIKKLPHKEEIHDKINSLNSNSVKYLLSIGVHEDYRRKGLASQLIDFLLNNFKNYYLVSDVSSVESLEIYRKRNFNISKIDEEYYFVQYQLK